MKNRLQFRYNDTLWATREDAVNYIDKYFSTDKYNGGLGNPSLKSEPLVLFYGPTPKESNVILAIGREGDGNDKFSNASYFIIDFAEHTELIKSLRIDVNDIKETATKNREELEKLIKQEKERAQLIENNLFKDYSEKIEEEKQRAIGVEDEIFANLSKQVQKETTRAQEKESELETQITKLIDRVIIEENKSVELQTAIEAETERAINRENELERNFNDNLHIEKDRAEKEENDIKANASRIEAKLDSEIQRSNKEDDEFKKLFNEALNVEREHTIQISSLNELVKQNTDNINKNVDEIAKNKVVSTGKTINIQSIQSGTDLSINIDNNTIQSNDGVLSVNSDAFVKYIGESAIEVNDIDDKTKKISLKVGNNDKLLVNDVNGLYVDLHIELDNNNKLRLIGKDNTLIGEIDMNQFVVDGMLEDVKVEGEDLVFIFNVDAQPKIIKLPIKSLVKIYTAGDGIKLIDSVLSIQISDKNEDSYLKLDSTGIYVSGINNSINNAKTELQREIDLNKNEITEIKSNLVNVKNEVTAGYKADDLTLSNNLKSEITATKELLQSEIDKKVLTEESRATLIESDLQSQITKNKEYIDIFKDDVKQDGSIKHIVYDAAWGQELTTINPDDARAQSLIKKITIDGKPHFYVPNKTDDIYYNNNSLTNVINELKGKDGELTTNLTDLISQINILQNQVQTLVSDNEKLKTDLSILRTEFDILKQGAITEIQQTDKETKVTRSGNTVKIGFADDAEFIAG